MKSLVEEDGPTQKDSSDMPVRPSRRHFVGRALGTSLLAAGASAAPQSRAEPSATRPQRGLPRASPGRPFHAWAPVPPMGWNSWDAFGASVTEAEYLENSRVLAERLLPFGYDTSTVDIQWYEPSARSSQYRPFAPLVLDGNGRPQPAVNRFPSASDGRGFAPLADQIHRMGLRFGVHILRGIPRQAVGACLPIANSRWRCDEVADIGSTCAWNTDMCGANPDHPGAIDWYRSWMGQLAQWGVDFVKVDDIAAPIYHKAEVELIRQAIDACGRSMVLSLSPGPSHLDEALHLQSHANQWRICDDFWDNWKQLRENLVNLVRWAPYARPGAWPDADMLPVGKIGLRDDPRDNDSHKASQGRVSGLTHDEQVLMLTAWVCARSPMILGCDLRQLDDWTFRLIANPEVLVLLRATGVREWTADGKGYRFICAGADSMWIAWLNTTDAPISAELPQGSRDTVRDCWARMDLSRNAGPIDVPAHGARLIRCT